MVEVKIWFAKIVSCVGSSVSPTTAMMGLIEVPALTGSISSKAMIVPGLDIAYSTRAVTYRES